MDVTVIGNGSGGGEDPGEGGGDNDYGDLGIFFDTSAPAVNPGQTLEIPFTVTGSEGATLSLVPSVDNDEYVCALGKVDYVNYQGIIKLTAPEVITEATEVKVSLTASDTHKRSLTKSVSVKVNASEPLSISALGEPASMAVKAGGSFTLSYKVLNLTPAKIAENRRRGVFGMERGSFFQRRHNQGEIHRSRFNRTDSRHQDLRYRRSRQES